MCDHSSLPTFPALSRNALITHCSSHFSHSRKHLVKQRSLSLLFFRHYWLHLHQFIFLLSHGKLLDLTAHLRIVWITSGNSSFPLSHVTYRSRNVPQISCLFIGITYRCKCDHLKPRFIGKLEFTLVYIIVLFLHQNIDCGYSLTPPQSDGSNVYPQSLFRVKQRKISKLFN